MNTSDYKRISIRNIQLNQQIHRLKEVNSCFDKALFFYNRAHDCISQGASLNSKEVKSLLLCSDQWRAKGENLELEMLKMTSRLTSSN